jgi:hypothetical protein
MKEYQSLRAVLFENIYKLGALYFDTFQEIADKSKIVLPFTFTDKEQYILNSAFTGKVIRDIDLNAQSLDKSQKKPFSLYSVEYLSKCMIGVIIAESSIGMERVSVSATIGVFFAIAIKDYKAAQKIVDYVLPNYDNSYLDDLESRRVELYQFIYKYSDEEDVVKKIKLKLQIAGYIKYEKEKNC